MYNKGNKSTQICLFVFGLIVIVWFALRITPDLYNPNYETGLIALLNGAKNAFSEPFPIEWRGLQSVKVIAIAVLIYTMGIVIYFTTKQEYRLNDAYGSAKWGNVSELVKKYKSTDAKSNRIFTKKFKMSTNTRQHQRNLNSLIVGGAGSSKTRGYVIPNILQCNTSYVVTDPKGEIARSTVPVLLKNGYRVCVLDLIEMERSCCYNPFVYAKTDNDFQKLASNLFNATQPKEKGGSQDPFWDDTAKMLLSALMYYLHYVAPPEEQNFSMVMELLRAGQIEDEDNPYSPLDELFYELQLEDPDNIAVKYYKNYKASAGKTMKSIQITLAARLEKFNLNELADLTNRDDIHIDKIGAEKTAVFLVIPEDDPSFNFIVTMFYSQLFNELKYVAEHCGNGGRLPVPVHCIMDEFANIQPPDNFEKIVSIIRSREISVSIILQSFAQLKAMFKDTWEGIVDNCDEFLYLGGNSKSTFQYISELLDKETINTRTFGESRGRNGNFNRNSGQTGRNLLTPGEVRKLSNDYCLLFVRGEDAIIDRKYNLKTHENYKFTAYENGEPFEHQRPTVSVSSKFDIPKDAKMQTVVIDENDILAQFEIQEEYSNVQILTNEDIEQMFNLND